MGPSHGPFVVRSLMAGIIRRDERPDRTPKRHIPKRQHRDRVDWC
jgi:hypothetical protein